MENDRKIMKGVCRLMLAENDGEFEIVFAENRELASQRALDIMAMILGDIPENAQELRDEWERRANFLAAAQSAARQVPAT